MSDPASFGEVARIPEAMERIKAKQLTALEDIFLQLKQSMYVRSPPLSAGLCLA